MKTKSPKNAFAAKIVIEYYWRCESFPKGIPHELQEALTETAEERITEMMAEGYHEGELSDTVNMQIKGRRTPDDGFECSGWFTISRENS